MGKGKNAGNSIFSFSHSVFYSIKQRNSHFSNVYLSSANALNLVKSKIFGMVKRLKVALQILGQNFYKKYEKNHPYTPESLLIFIRKTPVVENHPTTGETRELLRPRLTPTGITVYFYMSSLLIYILDIHRRKFQT